jgi:hypothetical protein
MINLPRAASIATNHILCYINGKLLSGARSLQVQEKQLCLVLLIIYTVVSYPEHDDPYTGSDMSITTSCVLVIW